jgi:dihydroorotate dehydrogenase (fumarate)
MTDLTTAYLGLHLRNPLVASSSPLSADLDNIRKMEDAGAAAIVMHSLFEEKIEITTQTSAPAGDGAEGLAESLASRPDLREIYLPDADTDSLGPEGYLEHLRRAKLAVQIPIIASLNGVAPGDWTRYAARMEEAGADAVELNTYDVPAELDVTSPDVEQRFCDLVRQVKSQIEIPLAVKLSPYFSAMANVAQRVHKAGADGLVLFNRFYEPDFDLERLEVIPNLDLSDSRELLLRVHWVSILSRRIHVDLAVSGGVHTAEDVLKAILAGARVAMMTSALIRNGIYHFRQVLADLEQWMEKRHHLSLQKLRGSMAMAPGAEISTFERANYVRLLTSRHPRTPNNEPAG